MPPISFSAADIVLCLIIFQLLFASLYLFSLERGKRVSNGLLGGFFLTFALNFMDTLLLMKGVYFQYPAWGLWGTNMALLFGPLLYLYTRSVIYRDFYLRPQHSLHALPFLTLTAVSLAGYYSLTHDQKQQLLRQILAQSLPSSFYLVSALIFLHFFAYLALSLLLIRRYRRTLNQNFSDIQNKNLSWLRSTILFFLIFFWIGAFRSFLIYTPLVSYQFVILISLLLGLLWFINRFLFRALQQPDFFLGITEEILQPVPPPETSPTTPSSADHMALLQQLASYMATQKPWLQPELTLDDLADQLGVRPKTLSQAINDGLGQHFFDYINRYRIEEARRLLTNPPDPKITVLEVMYKVGFNSKSSFNTLFKKYTGRTPSEVKAGRGL